jgi:hypothetical protein
MVVDAIMALGAMLLGGLQKAWEAVQNAVNVILDWLLKIIKDAVDTILRPLVTLFSTWFSEVSVALEDLIRAIVSFSNAKNKPVFLQAAHQGLFSAISNFLDVLLLGSSIMFIFFSIGVAFEVFELTLKAFTMGLSQLLSVASPFIINLIKGAVIAVTIAQLVNVVFENVLELLPSNIDDMTNLAFAAVDVIMASITVLAAKTTALGRFIPLWASTAGGFAAAGLSFILLLFSTKIPLIVPSIVNKLYNVDVSPGGFIVAFFKVLVDIISVWIAFKGTEAITLDPIGRFTYPLFYDVADTVGTIAEVFSVSGTIIDSASLGTAIAKGVP